MCLSRVMLKNLHKKFENLFSGELCKRTCYSIYFHMCPRAEAGNTNGGIMLSKVDLLIKVPCACFVKKVDIFKTLRFLILLN
jgi:hypothetical protein